MSFQKTKTGCTIIPIKNFADERGWFTEVSVPAALNAPIQINMSYSRNWVVRGIHMQAHPHAQSKLVRVLSGVIEDFVIDLDPSSPTYKQSEVFELQPDTFALLVPPTHGHSFWVPPFAADHAQIIYQCDKPWTPSAEVGINPLSAGLDTPWFKYFGNLVVSDKDMKLPLWKDFVSPFGVKE